MDAAIQRIRGPEGSSLTVTVKESGGGDPVDVKITRRRLKS